MYKVSSNSFFKFHIQTGRAQQGNVCRHKMDESGYVKFGLSCSESTLLARATDEFQKSRKCDILKSA